MGWVWILVCAFTIADSRAPGTGNSEEVTYLIRSRGEDAVFRLDQKIGNDTQRIMWISASKQLNLANIFAWENRTNWITNHTQFKGRLSLLSNKSLKLSKLTTKDSGCYEAEIKSFLGEITTQKFNLTVLENDSANFNNNLGIIMAVIILLIVLACYLSRKLPGARFSCFSSRGEPHTEENGHFQMASSRTNEESQRMLNRALPFATIQEDVVEMQNGLGTQPENSRDQHRQELSDEEENNTESMDHRRTTDRSSLTTSIKDVGSYKTHFCNVLASSLEVSEPILVSAE